MYHIDFPAQPRLSIKRRLPRNADYPSAYCGLTDLLDRRISEGADPRALGEELVRLIFAAFRKTSSDQVQDTFQLYPFLTSVNRSVLSSLHNNLLVADEVEKFFLENPAALQSMQDWAGDE